MSCALALITGKSRGHCSNAVTPFPFRWYGMVCRLSYVGPLPFLDGTVLLVQRFGCTAR